MNAHELADALQETEPYYSTDYKLFDNAANMLRQQADRIAELEKPHKYDPETGEPLIDGYPLFSGLPRPQTKPLSDEEIKELIANKVTDSELCRAIEERHGIK